MHANHLRYTCNYVIILTGRRGRIYRKKLGIKMEAHNYFWWIYFMEIYLGTPLWFVKCSLWNRYIYIFNYKLFVNIFVYWHCTLNIWKRKLTERFRVWCLFVIVRGMYVLGLQSAFTVRVLYQLTLQFTHLASLFKREFFSAPWAWGAYAELCPLSKHK